MSGLQIGDTSPGRGWEIAKSAARACGKARAMRTKLVKMTSKVTLDPSTRTEAGSGIQNRAQWPRRRHREWIADQWRLQLHENENSKKILHCARVTPAQTSSFAAHARAQSEALKPHPLARLQSIQNFK